MDKLEMKILEAAEEILGLPQDEMSEQFELDLLENGLIDSLGCVAVMAYMEEALGRKLDLAKMEPDDFTSLRAMTDAIRGMIQ